MYEHGAMIVPVDSPDRDRYIDCINKQLNINLKPDWETVVNGYHNTHNLTYKDVEPSDEIKQVERDVSRFLNNFYPEVKMTEAAPKKKRGRPKKEEPVETDMVEVIALRKMMNDETGEMAEIGERVKKERKYAIILQDKGVIKVPL